MPRRVVRGIACHVSPILGPWVADPGRSRIPLGNHLEPEEPSLHPGQN